MNNMRLLLVGVVVVVVLVAGYLLLSNRSSAPQNNTQTEQAPAETSEMIDSKETTVTVTESGYEPATITVSPGDSVVWLNQSGGVANVSSDNHPTHLRFPFLNLGNFEDGQTVSVVFEESGTFSYHDHLTPSRTGTVVVK